MDTRVLSQKLLDQMRFNALHYINVGAASIPEQEGRSVYVSQKMTQKPHHLFSPYVFVGVELEIQRHTFL